MARIETRSAAILVVALPLFLSATMAAAEDARVGVTAAVNPDTVGQPPAAAPRALLIGADVMFKERIATTDTGQAQLLFLDQSSLAVAPSSEVVIDEFVYDPRQNAGKQAATVSKGLMRYVGGTISKRSEVTFTTPSATIGIRGGVAVIQVAPNGGTTAAFVYGQHMGVTANGVTETVIRPGFTVTVGQPGQPPSPPTPTPKTFIQSALVALEGRADSTGGATQPPTDQGFAQSGLGSQLQSLDRLAVQSKISSSRAAPQPVIVVQLPNATSIVDNAAQNAQRDAIAIAVATITALPPPPLPPPPPAGGPPPPPPPPPPPDANSINQFDGRNPPATASASPANPRGFTGTFGASAAATAGTLNGRSFQSGGVAIAATGSRLAVRNAMTIGNRALGTVAAGKAP